MKVKNTTQSPNTSSSESEADHTASFSQANSNENSSATPRSQQSRDASPSPKAGRDAWEAKQTTSMPRLNTKQRAKLACHEVIAPPRTVTDQIAALLQQPRQLNLIELLLEDLPQDLVISLLEKLLPGVMLILKQDEIQAHLDDFLEELEDQLKNRQTDQLEELLKDLRQKNAWGTFRNNIPPDSMVQKVCWALLGALSLLTFLPPLTQTPGIHVQQLIMRYAICLYPLFVVTRLYALGISHSFNDNRVTLRQFLELSLLQRLLSVLRLNQIEALPEDLQKKLLESLQQGLQQKGLLKYNVGQHHQLQIFLRQAQHYGLIGTGDISTKSLHSDHIPILQKALQQSLQQAQQKNLLTDLLFTTLAVQIQVDKLFTLRQAIGQSGGTLEQREHAATYVRQLRVLEIETLLHNKTQHDLLPQCHAIQTKASEDAEKNALEKESLTQSDYTLIGKHLTTLLQSLTQTNAG
jgi:hypothetical protein